MEGLAYADGVEAGSDLRPEWLLDDSIDSQGSLPVDEQLLEDLFYQSHLGLPSPGRGERLASESPQSPHAAPHTSQSRAREDPTPVKARDQPSPTPKAFAEANGPARVSQTAAEPTRVSDLLARVRVAWARRVSSEGGWCGLMTMPSPLSFVRSIVFAHTFSACH